MHTGFCWYLYCVPYYDDRQQQVPHLSSDQQAIRTPSERRIKRKASGVDFQTGINQHHIAAAFLVLYRYNPRYSVQLVASTLYDTRFVIDVVVIRRHHRSVGKRANSTCTWYCTVTGSDAFFQRGTVRINLRTHSCTVPTTYRCHYEWSLQVRFCNRFTFCNSDRIFQSQISILFSIQGQQNNSYH